MSTTKWKTLDGGPRPHVTVSGIVADSQTRNVLLLHRSNEVRSAKNCWALPSGLGEIAVPLEKQLITELEEELSISQDRVLGQTQLGWYENITHSDGYHWVILIYLVWVNGFDGVQNLEPHKHNEIKIVAPYSFYDMIGDDNVVWAPHLREELETFLPQIKKALS